MSKEIVQYTIGNIIGFRYKGNRYVEGTVMSINGSHNTVDIKLSIDYIGKNDSWYEDEVKTFNISEMKKVTIIRNGQV